MAAAVAVAALLAGSPAGADPAQWPAGPGVDPQLDATAHTVRFSGADRYQTNLATTLALRGGGDFPYSGPDASGGQGPALAEADHWWGAGSCPYAVLVVAGDTFADALAAASLSDPTNRSNEPWLQRVGTADPLFDPVGGFDRVDTEAAPVVVTRSARQGARKLDPAARTALDDLRRGGCTTAREAIVVGGEGAVAPDVVAELVDLGYEEVFRVAGADRFATAAAVAEALGTGAVPASPACVDDDAGDGDARMGFYGNAAPEFRFAIDTCRVLSRSVVLADGGTGADALAAGWWTSFWQVPVLLVAPDGSLPAATRAALRTLEIDHVIVLGGTARIPEATVTEAGALATAAVGRIAGADRYATSVEMARLFGGWYADGSGRTGRSSMVCLAGSAGSGEHSVGWPDALAAGPWCARASGAAAALGAPQRALAPVDGEHALAHGAGGERAANDALPILLTPPGAGTLPASVAGFLEDVFDPSASWCSARVAPGSCQLPGFGVIFGGTGVVSSGAALRLANLVSGSRYAGSGDVAPSLGTGFPTRLHLGPVFGVPDGPGEARVCFPRGTIRDVRWLDIAITDGAGPAPPATDLASGGHYDGGRSVPLCQPLGAVAAPAEVVGVSLSGSRTDPQHFDLGASWLSLSRTIEQVAMGTADGWSADSAPGLPVEYRVAGLASPVVSATLDLQSRVIDDGLAPFTGTGTLRTGLGPIELTVDGEAVLEGTRWRLGGRATARATPSGPLEAVGGFVALVQPDASGAQARLQWTIDGLVRAG